MRKSNESSLKQVIDQLLDTYRLRDKINEVKIKKVWTDLMGKSISNRTSDISLKNGVLYIRVTSAPLKEELLFQRNRILELMNIELEGPYVKEVVIL